MQDIKFRDVEGGEANQQKADGEKALEQELMSKLRVAANDVNVLIHRSGRDDDVISLADLVGPNEVKIFEDHSGWWNDAEEGQFKKGSHALEDVSGGMTPDIVLRSKESQQNRILIEVKDRAPLGHDKEASQLARYFLHLLATTTKKSAVRRAVLIAAPRKWFVANHEDWQHFLTHYSGIAAHFDITLGAIYTD